METRKRYEGDSGFNIFIPAAIRGEHMLWLQVIGFVVLLPSVFIVRSVYAFLQPDAFGGDSFDHLLYARSIARNDHRIPRDIGYLATGGFAAYPYFLHWVVSFLPSTWADAIDNYASGTFDVIYVTLFGIAAATDVLSWTAALVGGIIFLATPQFVRPDMSHGTGLSARKPGQFVTTTAVLSFLVWVFRGGSELLAIAVLAGAVVFLTSKFAVQAFSFVMLGLSLTVDVTASAVLVAAFIVAVVASKGRYLEILAGHYRHLKNYALEYQFRISYTKPTDLSALLADLRSVSSAHDIFRLGRNNAIIRPLVSNPFLIGLFALVILGATPPTPLGFDAWVLVGVGAFVLTSLPLLRFLGQAERYLEFTFFPAAVILARAWGTGIIGNFIVTTVILAGVVVVVIYIYGYHAVLGDDERRQDLRDVADYLNENGDGVFFVQPRWDSAELAWRTGRPVIDISINAGSTPGTIEEANRLFPVDAGYFTDDSNWLREQYDPDQVVFLRDSAEYPTSALRPPDIDPEYSNDLFAVFPFNAITNS